MGEHAVYHPAFPIHTNTHSIHGRTSHIMIPEARAHTVHSWCRTPAEASLSFY